MENALESLGVDPSSVSYEMASVLIAARDYVKTVAKETPESETGVQVVQVIYDVSREPGIADWLSGWSWMTKDDSPRHVPENALKIFVLRRLREVGP
jgi:hypothetical protein